jgi:hypothetical protein
MNKHIFLFPTVLFICVLICRISFAQTAAADSSSRQSALNNAINLYNTALGNQAPIFTGEEYNFYDPHIKGTAYFQDINGFTDGAVFYDGTLYKHILMMYDLNTDQVAVVLPNHISRFSLIKERVKSFDFLNNHFININADSLHSNVITKSGYYNQLYNGKIEILGRYSKNIQTTTSSLNGLESYFTASNDYYLKRNGIYHKIGSQGSLLDVLKDKKKELKQAIKADKLRYKDNPEAAMVKIATWYDHLTN